MPLYEYKCEQCGHSFEQIVHFDEHVSCPRCSGEVRKLMSTFAVEVPDEQCGKLPKGEKRELCTACKHGEGTCPYAAM